MNDKTVVGSSKDVALRLRELAEELPTKPVHLGLLQQALRGGAAEIEQLRSQLREWVKANGPGGWVDDLRKRRSDETPVAREDREYVDGLEKRIVDLAKGGGVIIGLLEDAMERMTRARRILTHDDPRPDCNWGMLDASDLRKRLLEGPAQETPEPTKGEVLESIRAGRVTYPPEVLPTGRWMPVEETAVSPTREEVERRAQELRETGVKLIPNSWRCEHGTVYAWPIAVAICGCERPSEETSELTDDGEPASVDWRATQKANAVACGNPVMVGTEELEGDPCSDSRSSRPLLRVARLWHPERRYEPPHRFTGRADHRASRPYA